MPPASDGKPQRFPRHARLVDKASFHRVFKNATRSRDNLFTVLSAANTLDEPRLGLAISRRNCRHASGRNRLKRVARESFRQHRGELGGLDFVIMNQPAAKDASNAALFASLDRHWQRCVARHAGTSRTNSDG